MQNPSNVIQDILTELKVIGSIQHGQKINTQDKRLELHYPSTLQAILRWYRGEDRTKNFERISKCFNSAFQCIDQLLTQPNSETRNIFLARLLQALDAAANGLKKLKSTYKTDVHSTSSFDMLIENVYIYRNMLIKKFPDETSAAANLLTNS